MNYKNGLKSQKLVPFLAKNKLYGYWDQAKNVVIAPQYLSAKVFTSTGFAVVTDNKGKVGVINTKNKVVVGFRFRSIELYVVRKFTVVSALRYYTVKTRFWEWKFLPNFNILSRNSSFSPLFDKDVNRARHSVFVLETNQTIARVSSSLKSTQGLQKIPIEALSSKFIQIGHHLYKAKVNSFVKLLSNFKGTYDHKLKLVRQLRADKVKTYNLLGKKIKSYELIQSRVFPITYKGKEHLVYFKINESHWKNPPTIYRDTKTSGRYFVNEQFDMPLPVHLKSLDLKQDRPLLEIWQNVVNIDAVVSNNFFLIEVLPSDKTRTTNDFYILTTTGVLKDYLPDPLSYSVTSYEDLIWPNKYEIIAKEDFPVDSQFHKVRNIGFINEPYYYVSYQLQDELRTGLWDALNKRWIIQPEYHSLTVLKDLKFVRFRRAYDSQFGLMDLSSNVVIPDRYNMIHYIVDDLYQVVQGLEDENQIMRYYAYYFKMSNHLSYTELEKTGISFSFK
ncbi:MULTISPECIES: WG repeat-containing protein [Myroides]|uniref:WG repeat-containing protein n=1 Tax=Myroides albus TaxID=2562892 RepID=A0A6I3LQ38_9FLAO|nr:MULTISPECIES: WG repeat-containing protein [Myroides]MTG98232.1 hypothetical protein [Myroides albus]MVX35017.1 hypothetical protein [Myroides sp. LoEW2-1]UVD79041.1 WG repeat-containing protein [Myroides albus]